MSTDANCDHCKKKLPQPGFGAIYYRGALLHPECRMPYILSLRTNELEPYWSDKTLDQNSIKGR